MEKDALLAKVKQLLGKPLVDLLPNTSLQEKLQHAWQARQLGYLDHILTSTEKDSLKAALGAFLASNWEATRGTALCLTAQPRSSLTDIFLDVAAFIRPNEPITVLMPGLNCFSLVDDDHYPDLATAKRADLANILKTHVLDTNYDLLPVRVLTKLSLPLESHTPIPHPYHLKGAYVLREQLTQLAQHSDMTEAIINAALQYQLANSDTDSLLSQLQLLCRHLSLNSVAGRGAEDNAAGGAYPAIIAFDKFYKKLTDAQKETIPTALKDEIDTLLNLSSDVTVNMDATANLATCIATRKTNLKSAMIGHDIELSVITLSETNKEAAIGATIAAFREAQSALIDALANQSYLGYDKQPITSALLHIVGLDWQIGTEADVKALGELTGDEIAALLTNQNLLDGLIGQIPTLENLVIFVMQTSEDKLPVFFSALNELLDNLVKKPDDLAALLMSLPPGKLKVVVELLSGRIMTSGTELADTLSYLTKDQCQIVLETMQARLPVLIKNGNDLLDVLTKLDTTQRGLVLEAVSARLHQLIQSGNELCRVLPLLDKTQCRIVLEGVRASLPQLIQFGVELVTVLAHIDTIQHGIVLQAVSANLSNMLQNRWGLHHTLAHLDATQCLLVLEAIKERVPHLITDYHDLCYVLNNLDLEQSKALLSMVQRQLIKSPYDLGAILDHLDVEQGRLLLSVVPLAKLIPSHYELSDIFGAPDADRDIKRMEVMKNYVLTLVKDTDSLELVLELLSEKERLVLVQAMPALQMNEFLLQKPEVLKSYFSYKNHSTIDYRNKLTQIMRQKNDDDNVSPATFIDGG